MLELYRVSNHETAYSVCCIRGDYWETGSQSIVALILSAVVGGSSVSNVHDRTVRDGAPPFPDRGVNLDIRFMLHLYLNKEK